MTPTDDEFDKEEFAKFVRDLKAAFDLIDPARLEQLQLAYQQGKPLGQLSPADQLPFIRVLEAFP